jgi:flagellar basal-body rod protein FlgB
MDQTWLGSRLFNRTTAFLQKSLDLRLERHTVLASNIANSETPNYQARDIPFAKILNGLMQNQGALDLRQTHPRHLAGEAESGIDLEKAAEGVDMDREMAKLSENHLRFQAEVQVLAKKLEGLRYAIEGGK